MTDNDSQTRIEVLEIRLAQQEAAIDELTRVLLRQEKHIREHKDMIERLELQVRALAPADGAPNTDEKPPHY
jgi:SlyX protein